MWTHFFLENIHFALNVFGALVFFAVSWLYFDAFLVRKMPREAIRTIGFILVSLSFLIHATHVESSLVASAILSPGLHTLLFSLTRIPGFFLVVISLLFEPIQTKPQTQELSPNPPAGGPPPPIGQNPTSHSVTTHPVVPTQNPSAPNPPPLASPQVHAFFPFSLSSVPVISSPVLILATTLLYFRRATTGLERHLFPVSLGFLLLSVSDFLSLRSLFITTTNVSLYNLVAPFGSIWIIEHTLLFVALLLLSRWVFGYLLKRFETQLFMIFTVTILAIFLLTSVTFTGLLVNQLVNLTLSQLTTDAQVLWFAIESKEKEVLTDAELLAQDPRTIDLLTRQERRELALFSQTHLLTRKLSGLLITNKDGQVVANGEDTERFGYSVSADPVVSRAMGGESVSSLIAREGTLTKNITVVAAVPIKKDAVIIGTVFSSSVIDTAFLDGVKKATGLEASVYADNVLTATTIVSPDGVTRPVGIRELSPAITLNVLKNNIPYTGSLRFLNRSYFASYLPILDATNRSVGMISIGKPQNSILETASRAIELTFLITGVLLLFSVFPAYGISRLIVSQIR